MIVRFVRNIENEMSASRLNSVRSLCCADYLLWLFCVFLLVGCSTAYEKTATSSWDELARGNSKEVVKKYEDEVKEPRDRLLKLMDEGVALRVGGEFKASNEKFFAADKILEQAGYTSITEETASVLLNERLKVYQGEDFEKVIVHLYLALNFLSLKDLPAALIETRRVNEILYQMISKSKRPYQLNAFAQYLGGSIYEQSREWNDAYIAYRSAFETAGKPRWDFLGRDLIRNALRLGFSQEVEEWTIFFGADTYRAAYDEWKQKEASVILFFEAGKSPMKVSSREKHFKKDKEGGLIEVLIPISTYQARTSSVNGARLCLKRLEKGSAEACSASVTLFDVESTAITHLKDRMGRQVAKALLSAGVKSGVAVGLGKATDSQALGLLTGLLLFAASEADTRSWLLLPKSFQVARLSLNAGEYAARVEFLAGSQKIEERDLGKLRLKPGAIQEFQARSFR